MTLFMLALLWLQICLFCMNI